MINNSVDVEEINIRKIARQLLKELGFKVHYLGFKYWISAIEITVDIDKSNKKICMMELYELIAKKYRTTNLRVEKDMRYLHKERNVDVRSFFNVNYSVSSSALLFLLVEEVKNRVDEICLKTCETYV